MFAFPMITIVLAMFSSSFGLGKANARKPDWAGYDDSEVTPHAAPNESWPGSFIEPKLGQR
jgi:hypothetical protein